MDSIYTVDGKLLAAGSNQPFSLSAANLSYADVRGRNLRNSKFVVCDMSRIQAEGVNLAGCTLSGTLFSYAHAPFANFAKSYSGAVDFYQSNLYGADFSDAKLGATSFQNCDLRNADFSRAKLVITDFRGAKLEGADFTGADIYTALFSN